MQFKPTRSTKHSGFITVDDFPNEVDFINFSNALFYAIRGVANSLNTVSIETIQNVCCPITLTHTFRKSSYISRLPTLVTLQFLYKCSTMSHRKQCH